MPGWTVIDQQERTGRLPNGSFGQVVRITYRTALGVVRSVDIDADTYRNVDAVKDIIDAEATRTDEIASL